jgi:hypothetical protein
MDPVEGSLKGVGGWVIILGAILTSSMSNSNVKRESVPYRNGASGGSFQIRWLLSEANLVGPGDLKQAPIDISLGRLSSDTLTAQAPKLVCLLTDLAPRSQPKYN